MSLPSTEDIHTLSDEEILKLSKMVGDEIKIRNLNEEETKITATRWNDGRWVFVMIYENKPVIGVATAEFWEENKCLNDDLAIFPDGVEYGKYGDYPSDTVVHRPIVPSSFLMTSSSTFTANNDMSVEEARQLFIDYGLVEKEWED